MMKSFNEELGKLISYNWTKAVDSNDEDRRIKNLHFKSWGENHIQQPLHFSDGNHSKSFAEDWDVWLHLFDNYGAHHRLMPRQINFVHPPLLAFLLIFINKDLLRCELRDAWDLRIQITL